MVVASVAVYMQYKVVRASELEEIGSIDSDSSGDEHRKRKSTESKEHEINDDLKFGPKKKGRSQRTNTKKDLVSFLGKKSEVIEFYKILQNWFMILSSVRIL